MMIILTTMMTLLALSTIYLYIAMTNRIEALERDLFIFKTTTELLHAQDQLQKSRQERMNNRMQHYKED